MESLRGLLSSPASAYDELVTGQKSIRYHWQGIISVVRALPGGGLAERVESARRQLEESGATANLADETAPPRWAFDPLPLVLAPDEWHRLEAGVAQRARLLDLILADAYGARTLVDRHLLPPALLQGNARYLRPARDGEGASPPRRLAQYAVDLVRLPDGRWHVLADHTESPAGAGYAMEIRRVLARSLPEAFRSVPVRQLRSFADHWQDSLPAFAPGDVARPGVALLTPGPGSLTYFEHAWLARTLGLPLVQGGDLVARQDGIALKTLAGLRPIHVLLRRLDSAFADPLELRDDSVLGVAGLLDAVRDGRVALANALGSGAAETPALMPFLPGLAEALLGEAPLLPSLDVWWLGEPAARDFALARLDTMIVRRCLDGDREPIVVGMLEAAERAALDAAIRARPAAWVAQFPFMPSLSPKWDGQGLAPAAVVLRLFAVADGEGWRVMPGGLAREPAGDTALRGLSRLDGTLKDVWVIAEDAADATVPPARRFHQLAVDRGGGELQSRIADDLFWMGRYAERLDNGARLLRAAVQRVAQGALGGRDLAELRLLARELADADLIDPAGALSAPDSDAFREALAGCAADGRALANSFTGVRRLSRALRDRFSADMASTAQRLMSQVRRRLLAARGNVDPLLASLDEIVRFVATFSGLAQENMTRGAGWRFLDLGRRLERGQFAVRDVVGGFGRSPIDWDAAMRVALDLSDSTITYRNRYLGQLQPAPVLDLVLLDGANPRSLAFQSAAIDDHLAGLEVVSGLRIESLPATLGEDLTRAVEQFSGDERVWRHEGLALAMLREVREDALQRLEALSAAITRAWFSHAAQRRPTGGD